MQANDETEDFFAGKDTLQSKVFALLKDRKWHCRGCEGAKISSTQYAGGGGIQGLQRGSGKRPGFQIETKRERCEVCGSVQTWDRWTGEIKTANAASGIPPVLHLRILAVYRSEDVIEQRKRAPHELIIDHRFPMERRGASEEPNPPDMSEADIRRKFQLLKKDGSGNHNLLKSRACETCIKTNRRGQPFGVPFWYQGAEEWDETIPKLGAEAEAGCIGCGWYDFEAWREALSKSAKRLMELNRKASEEEP